MTEHNEPMRIDAVIVGAGFSGMYMLHSLKQRGQSARVFEAADGVGGTWYWNRYPGARCDVESVEYQYGFSDALQREWQWTERYPAQPEILRYLNWVADKLDLRDDIQLGARIASATYDEHDRCWIVTTQHGQRISAQYCIMATGCLSAAQLPKIAGLETFAGDAYHTSAWPHTGVDLRGKRVAVIGTGSSGTQAIPLIAEEAEHLTVFQRTPNYSLPAFNRSLDPDYFAAAKETFIEQRRKAEQTAGGNFYPVGDRSALDMSFAEANAALEERWGSGGFAFLGTFPDVMTQIETNDIVSDFVRSKIRAVIEDPKIAEILTPTTHPFGAKRPCLDTNYFQTFNREDVILVDVGKTPIEKITPKGVLVGGRVYLADTIVFATGFDAMTGALNQIDIRGRGDMALRVKWEGGPRAYLGVASAGFPNLFMITGPGSPSVLTNVVTSIEQHVEWIVRCIDYMRDHGIYSIEATVDAENDWVDHVNEAAHATLMPQANSWYMGANIPGKPRIFMPYVNGLGVFRQKCDEIAADGYRGFSLV